MSRKVSLIVSVLAVLFVTACSAGDSTIGEEEFLSLLSAGDVERVVGGGVQLTPSFVTMTEPADTDNPAGEHGVVHTYVMNFETEDTAREVTFGLIEFETDEFARLQYDRVTSSGVAVPVLQPIEPPVGEMSAGMDLAPGDVGSILIFQTGDVVVSLHTGQQAGLEPLMRLAGLTDLARTIEEGLR